MGPYTALWCRCSVSILPILVSLNLSYADETKFGASKLETDLSAATVHLHARIQKFSSGNRGGGSGGGGRANPTDKCVCVCVCVCVCMCVCVCACARTQLIL